MSRPWQKFVAPGPDGLPLPIAESPWHSNRWVRIPYEHWNLIIDFASRLDIASAECLRSLSWATDDNEMDYIDCSSAELERMLDFVNHLSREIEHAPPLVPEATNVIPDRYPNDEHVRMLSAIAAVFQESIRRNQPFRAWSE